jgi:hypothetical protein
VSAIFCNNKKETQGWSRRLLLLFLSQGSDGWKRWWILFKEFSSFFSLHFWLSFSLSAFAAAMAWNQVKVMEFKQDVLQ